MELIQLPRPTQPKQPKYISKEELLSEIDEVVIWFARWLFLCRYDKKICSVCLDSVKNDKVFRNRKYSTPKYKCRTCVGTKSKLYDNSEYVMYMCNGYDKTTVKPYLKDIAEELKRHMPSLYEKYLATSEAETKGRIPTLSESTTLKPYMLLLACKDWEKCDKDIYIENVKKHLKYDIDKIRKSKYKADVKVYRQTFIDNQEKYKLGCRRLDAHIFNVMY